MSKHSIADFLLSCGFTGNIVINVLLEHNTRNGNHVGVYYFIYDDELYHIIVTRTLKATTISLLNGIASTILK